MKQSKPKIVPKPWGREIWLAEEREYAGKILEMKAGSRSSLHYHRKKKETMYVLSGEVRIEPESGEPFVLREGDCITINPGDRHRIVPLKDSRIVEASTPQLDDVVRIEDDYKR